MINIGKLNGVGLMVKYHPDYGQPSACRHISLRSTSSAGLDTEPFQLILVSRIFSSQIIQFKTKTFEVIFSIFS